MYGFDSIFDFNMNSFTDLVLESDRGLMNNQRLSSNWRPIWENLFQEFPNVTFKIHYFHSAFKIKTLNNVEAVVYKKEKQTTVETKVNFDQISEA
jgi:hypothetical protein